MWKRFPRVFRPHDNPILGTRGDGHERSCTISIVVGVSHDTPVMPKGPRLRGPDIRWETCSLDRYVSLCLSPAEPKPIVQLSEQGSVGRGEGEYKKDLLKRRRGHVLRQGESKGRPHNLGVGDVVNELLDIRVDVRTFRVIHAQGHI